MGKLDEIPWDNLTHAFGPAYDVPELLRGLKTAAPELQGDDSPLLQLFGNICHQGTVYEATAYAVPFLIELAVDLHTPDRVGILSLLAEIAKGMSYHDAHGHVFNLSKQPGFEQKRSQELLWVRNAHQAVAAGVPQFVELTKEPGDLGMVSVFVLSRLPEYGAATAVMIRKMWKQVTQLPYRAALLCMLGFCGDSSPETIACLRDAAQSAEPAERQAAVYSMARLKVRPLPAGFSQAVKEAIGAEELDKCLNNVPWYSDVPMDLEELFAALDAEQWEQVVDGLIAAVETRKSSVREVEALIIVLFPRAVPGPTPRLTAGGMTARQLRAVRALYQAMQTGERIFYGHFPQFGLPDTMPEWRALAAGHERRGS